LAVISPTAVLAFVGAASIQFDTSFRTAQRILDNPDNAHNSTTWLTLLVDVVDSVTGVVVTEAGAIVEDDEDLAVVVRNPTRRNGNQSPSWVVS
jgi:hypothetical protein